MKRKINSKVCVNETNFLKCTIMQNKLLRHQFRFWEVKHAECVYVIGNVLNQGFYKISRQSIECQKWPERVQNLYNNYKFNIMLDLIQVM